MTANAAFCEMLGYTPAEFKDKTWQEITHPDDLEFSQSTNQLLASGQKDSVRCIKRYLSKSGAVVWADSSACLRRDAAGAPLYIIAELIDITAYKQAETALQLSLEQTEHSRRLLLSLGQAAQAVQRARSPQEVYAALQEQMTQLGYKVTVYELQGPKWELRIAYLNYASSLVRKAEKLAGLSIHTYRLRPRQGSIFQRVLANGETIHVANLAQAVADALPKKLSVLARPITGMFHLEPSIFAPLVVEEKAFGVLVVSGAVSEADAPAVTAFANQAAIALYNAHLYEQAQAELARRKQAERDLKTSEQRFRDVTVNAREWIWEVDAQGKYTYASPLVERLLGYTPAEVLQKHFYDLFHPDERESLKSAAFAVFGTKQPFRDFINPNVHKNGQTVWLSTSGLPLLDDQGNLLGYRGADMDITESRQAEQDRRLAEAHYRSLVEQIPAITYIDNADLNAISSFVSPQVETLLGISQAEWRNGDINWWGSMIHPDDRKRVVTAYRHTLHTGEPFHEEYRMQARDGRMLWIDDHAALLEGTPGGARSVQGIMFDISERKQEELRKEIVYQVLSAVSGQLDLDLLGQSAMEILARISAYSHVCLALPDENGRRWVIRGAAGRLAAQIGTTYPIHQGVIGRAFKTGQRQWVRDALDDPDYVRDVRVADAPAMRSEIATPLRHGDQLLGVLNVESERVDAFDNEDAAMAQSLADGIALAVENAQLYQAAQREIAERKQAQEQLQESEQKFHMLFERNMDGILISDIETHRFHLFNPAMCQMLGYSEKELGGMRVEDIHPPEFLPYIFERFNRHAHAEDFPSEDIPVRRKDGSLFYADINARPIAMQGRTYMLSLFRDISARKQAEEKIKAQLDELQRWYNLTLDRETRALELKGEVNELLRRMNLPARYPSAEE